MIVRPEKAKRSSSLAIVKRSYSHLVFTATRIFWRTFYGTSTCALDARCRLFGSPELSPPARARGHGRNPTVVARILVLAKQRIMIHS
jgi:hypothetical protein